MESQQVLHSLARSIDSRGVIPYTSKLLVPGEVAESCLPAGRGRLQQSANYVVYFLQSQKDGKLYIGKTNNLDRRIAEHRQGQVSSTKARRPLVLLGYEDCKTESEALELEKTYKKGYKREELWRRFNL